MRKFKTIIFLLILAAIKVQSQSCFTKNWTGSGLDQMNFYITKSTINGVNLQVGDEIGVFDGNACVGAGVLTQVLLGGSVYLAIVASKDDPDTPVMDGYISGHSVSYRLCTNGSSVPITNVQSNYTTGSGFFNIGGTAVVELTGTVQVPTAPIVGTITQPTCAIPTGSVNLRGLPSSGSWTLTMIPGNISYLGSGTTYSVSGLDPGTYTFTVTNSAGFTSPSSGNVFINTRPLTPDQPGPITGSTTVCPGSSIAYKIYSVTGATSYIWTLPSGWTGSSTSITINAVAGTNGGTVSVASKNSCGNSTSSTLNVMMASKPSVTTSGIHDASSSTAIGGGNVTSDGGVSLFERGICWSTTANPTISNSRSSNGTSTGPFESTLTDLTNGATYHIRAYATNCAGTGYGLDIEYYHNSTGIEINQTAEISAFPNPVSGMLNIEYNDENFKSIDIISSNGMLLKKVMVISPVQQIDFSKYDYGLYFLKFVKQNGEIKSIKILNH